MPKKTSKSHAKRPRRKAPPKPYPSAPFEKAIQIPLKIKELNGGNPWTPEDVASAIGMSAKSSDFYYITAAARDFGLTTGTRDTATIELTDLGRDIAYAPNPDIEKQKKLEAFHKVELFSKVLNHYNGVDLP